MRGFLLSLAIFCLSAHAKSPCENELATRLQVRVVSLGAHKATEKSALIEGRVEPLRWTILELTVLLAIEVPEGAQLLPYVAVDSPEGERRLDRPVVFSFHFESSATASSSSGGKEVRVLPVQVHTVFSKGFPVSLHQTILIDRGQGNWHRYELYLGDYPRLTLIDQGRVPSALN